MMNAITQSRVRNGRRLAVVQMLEALDVDSV